MQRDSATTIRPSAARTVALALAASAAVASGCGPSGAPATMPVSVAGRTFQCRLAIDEAARERGMGGVAEIGPDEGMLFAFPGAEPHNFWMRDCLIGLDIAFIDAAGFVTAVHTMPAEPLRAEGESEDAYFARLRRYPSLTPAQYALEVAPGTLAPLGVRRGTRVEFDRALLKTLAK
ncbi:MAG: hypothetical protein RIS86_693 [Planctomycetota bacterium]